MNLPVHLVLVVTSLLACIALFTFGDSSCTTDYWGTEFHFGAPTSSIHYLYVIAKGSGQVHVEAPGNNLSKYLDVESSRIASICLNCQYYDLLGALSNTYNGDNGIKVSSTVDVSVTLICTDPDISVGIPLMPSSVLSSEYIVPSVASSTKDNYLIIAAKQNSSTVWVKTRNNSTWLHTTLNEFQTQKYGFLYDISGTIITSNYPVSVITYKYGLYNDIQKEIDAALQVIPTHAWGQKYIVPIFNITDPGYFRTFAVSDNTYVHVVENSRSSTVFLNRGQYVDYDSKADHVIVSSTNPIMVINYGANNDSMIHIPALSQYKSSHSFFVVPNVLREHCLFIIVPKSHEDGITFRGHQHVPIREMASLVVLKNVRYVIAKFKLLTGGEFNVFHSSHSVPFGAILYSAGDRPYGYTVGMKLPIQGCTQSSVVTTAMTTMTTMTAKMGTAESIYVTNPHLSTNETICFSCQAMSSLVLCNHVQKCGPGKECYVERYITSSGEVRYSSGCSLTSVCNRQTKRSNGCKECCSGSYCNNAGCGDNSTPARSHRGPFCYSCAHVGRVEDCHTIRLCRSNEACSIEKSA